MDTLKINTDALPETPVLFLVFNRPEETRTVFEAVKRARPARLFIAQDGPRPGCDTDPEKCAQVRSILSEVDWDCDVRTLFREKNLGCGDAVSGAIDWFFDQVDEGIILEDDCVPAPSFFGYCTALLDHYRDDPRVMSICGHNFLQDVLHPEADIFFSKYTHIWGWATWKSAWQRYDRHMSSFPEFERQGRINDFIDDEPSRRHWLKYFRHAWLEGIDTWDFQWIYTVMVNSGLCVFPKKNLISNIGYRDQTNQFNYNTKWYELPIEDMDEIAFPEFVVSERRADRRLMRLFQYGMAADNGRSTEDLAGLYWFDLGPKLNYLHPQNIDPLPKNARICIYGYGQTGFELLDKIRSERPDITFVCWVDTYREETTGDDRIVRIDNIETENFDHVVIASIHYLDDIENRLKQRNLSAYFIYAPFERLIRHYYEKNLPSLRTRELYDNNLAILKTAQQALGIMNWQDPGVSGEGAFLETFLPRKKAPVVLDIGGHHGEYAKLVKKLSPEALVHSFEPNPASFPRLLAAAEKRCFIAHNLGCSDHDGELEIHDYTDDRGSVHASVHREVFTEIYHRESTAVPIRTVTVDTFCRDNGIEHIDLLKVDTEGHEMHVLRGAKAMIREKRIDAVHIEFNDMNVITRVFLKDFMELLAGWEFFRMLPDGLVPLGEYDARIHEIFSYQNIAALRKTEGGAS